VKAFVLPRLMSREGVINRMLDFVMNLPADKAWRIQIEEAKSERSHAQNAYLFGVAYKLLSEHTGYEKEDIHEYLLTKHFGGKLKKVPRTKYNPQGLEEVPVRTTTTDEHGRRSVLGKMEFAEYVSFVQRFAARHGVVVPDPDKDYESHREAA
jgi:hypothetical protein